MKKILLIDDEQINLFILENLLRLGEVEAEVIFYNTSKKAIEYLREIESDPAKQPNIILLDIEMPVMNGWDFLEEYQRLYADLLKETKIIIFTTSIVEQDKTKALTYELVDKYLNKPMTIEMLKDIEKEYLVN